jgi:hypothetical protein
MNRIIKKCLCIILFFTSYFSNAQITIKGTVYDAKGTLEGVAVYFNNSMTGTTTDKNGAFSLDVKEGNYTLIVSYLGFKKINYTLKTSEYTKALVFALIEETNTLDEVFLKKTRYDQAWKYNLSTFEREFIGISNLSKDCKIVNPKALNFEYNSKENILEAFANRPLKIKNKGLGYLITYDLVSFTKTGNYVTVVGYSRYENLKGSKRKKRRWKKNRLVAYNGSRVHFFKSVMTNKIEEEGFFVHQFKRVANPNRPSEQAIKKAKELIKLSRTGINFSAQITAPKTALDSAMVIFRKVKLPKFIDYLYASKLKSNAIFLKKNKKMRLNFEDNLSIVYTREKEEMAYILRNSFSKMRAPLPQTSSIIPINRPLNLDKLGVLINPLAIFYEGYWSYEKIANMLPLEYVLEK